MIPDRCRAETGSGDWTKDRKKILEKDPDKIIKSIMDRRKNVPARDYQVQQ